MRALPQAGDLVAGYRIERPIGRGGMGVVYLAEQVRLRRRVALKLIVPEYAEDEDFRRRFERESQLAASIDHPNVITVHEAGESDGNLFISMRYVEGSDLRELIRREGRLDQARAAWIVSQVAAALDAAHSRGLVHRDVKPANVLIAGDRGAEHAYLTDFGLTKHAGSSSGLTHTGQWVGTLDYVAPEQIEGGALDARVDVYSLGCVLFQALTGEVPYPKPNELAKMYAHLHELPPPVSAMGLPAAFDPVVGRAMAKNVDERYPSAGDLGRAALAAAAGEQNTVPERSVAAGSAALVTQRAAAPPPPATVPAARAPAHPPSAVTAHLPAAAPPPPAAAAQRRSRWPIVVAALAVLALGGAAAALLATGALESGGGSTTVVRQVTTAGGTTTTTTETTEQPTTSTQEQTTSGGEEGSASYTADGYSAQLPSDWTLVSDDVSKGAYSETKIESPDGSATVVIDRTPGAPIDPETAAAEVERDTRTTPGYSRVAWHSVDLGGKPGWEWVFDLPTGRRADYFTNVGSGRFAVLGHGSDYETARATAESVAQSLEPR